MGVVIKVNRKSKPKEVKKSLQKLVSKKKKKKIADFFGALPEAYEDGLTYQIKERNEW